MQARRIKFEELRWKARKEKGKKEGKKYNKSNVRCQTEVWTTSLATLSIATMGILTTPPTELWLDTLEDDDDNVPPLVQMMETFDVGDAVTVTADVPFGLAGVGWDDVDWHDSVVGRTRATVGPDLTMLDRFSKLKKEKFLYLKRSTTQKTKLTQGKEVPVVQRLGLRVQSTRLWQAGCPAGVSTNERMKPRLRSSSKLGAWLRLTLPSCCLCCHYHRWSTVC